MIEETAMVRKIPDWVINKQFRDYIIVSIDLCGSSKLKEVLKETRLIPLAFETIKTIVESWSNRCGGFFFFWAGDGGAVLFDGKIDNGEQNRLLALQFSAGVLFLSSIVEWEMINSIGCQSVKAEKESDIETIVLKIEDFIRTHCINSTAWNLSFNNTKLKSPKFRIVCHKGSIAVNTDSLDASYGDDLSYVLKYERELGFKNAITVTDSFGHLTSPLQLSDNVIESRRKCSDGGFPVLKIFPSDWLPHLDLNIKSISTASLFEIQDHKATDLVERISQCFEVGKGHKEAWVYNIGLGTFVYSLKELWLRLIDEYNVDINLLLITPFENNRKTHKMKTMDVLKEAIKKGLSNSGLERERVRETLKKAQLRLIDKRTISRLVKDESDLFGLRFGCSLYCNDSSEPSEGTNFFLTEPFCKWSTLDSEYGCWTYHRIFYFSDSYARQHLSKLLPKFRFYWEHSETQKNIEWPI